MKHERTNFTEDNMPAGYMYPDNLIHIINLCYENYQKIINVASGNYPPNYDNMNKVIHNIEQKKIGDWKYYLLMYKLIKDNITYVTFNEYCNTISNISSELLNYLENNIHTFEKIFFIPGRGDMTKSNTWVMLLFIAYMHSKLLEYSNKISIVDDIIEIGNDEYNDKNILCIYFDDMSYSGQQIMSNLFHNEFYELLKQNITTFIAAPYITKIAKQNINMHSAPTDNKINFFKNTKIIDNIMTVYDNWVMSDEIANLFKKYDVNPIEFRKKMCIGNNNICKQTNTIIYFDHKLADSLSTVQQVLALGMVPNDPDCELNSFITNCSPLIYSNDKYNEHIIDAPKKYTFCDIVHYDLSEYVIDGNKQCPVPIYKYIQYTLYGNIFNTNIKICENIDKIVGGIKTNHVLYGGMYSKYLKYKYKLNTIAI